jgi:hypothetical protein
VQQVLFAGSRPEPVTSALPLVTTGIQLLEWGL